MREIGSKFEFTEGRKGNVSEVFETNNLCVLCGEVFPRRVLSFGGGNVS